MSAQTPEIAVVIPAFNEAATLPEVVREAAALAERVWVVDDGSTDHTAETVRDLPCRLLRHPRNLGKGASLRTGLAAALEEQPAAVITLDADGQHPVRALPQLTERFRRHGDDLVIAARLQERAAMPRLRQFGNGVADFWIGLAGGRRVRDSQSGFRLYSARLLRDLPIHRIPGDRFDFEGRTLIEACRRGYAVGEVPIPALYPDSGLSSHYRAVVDTSRIIGMVASRILTHTLSALLPAGSRPRWRPQLKMGSLERTPKRVRKS
ncbi:MAG TPA: glycosyltransferase family 2 protein [Gammaproteobacteria bacterium]|nr:glycosyltransferase family 2 protein [Gammaproteobacteria bacterium]